MSDQPEPGSEAALNRALACLLLEAPESVVRDVSDRVRAFTDELRIDRDGHKIERDEARAEVERLRDALRICYECGSRPVVVSTAREALRESEARDDQN